MRLRVALIVILFIFSLFSGCLSNEPEAALDTDMDGIPDNIDDDDDDDGWSDELERLCFSIPWDSNSLPLDKDGDKICDNQDSDDDGDNVDDTEDLFPWNPLEHSDFDGDGIGDVSDADDDNDGIVDSEDAFPFNFFESSDFDNDGIGNVEDLDDDNDGVVDSDDIFPMNKNESEDLDLDGIGNNADLDDDGDGWNDSTETVCGKDPLDAMDTPNDKDGDGICDSIDPDLNSLLDSVRYNKKFENYANEDWESYGINITTWQLEHGGWEKWSHDEYQHPWDGKQQRTFYTAKNGTDLGSLADLATTAEIRLLSWLYINSTDDYNRSIFKDSVRRGVDFVLNAQHSSGGWPQVYPDRDCNGCNYTALMTYNDYVIASSFLLLWEIRDNKAPFNSDILMDLDNQRLQNAVENGLEFILKSQIIVNGTRTIWGQQHDPFTYESLPARAFELACKTSAESVPITAILLNWEERTEEVKNASWSAVIWFQEQMILNQYFSTNDGNFIFMEGKMMWYRYYNVSDDQFFMAGRDGVKVYQIEDLTMERRTGYSWGGDWASLMMIETAKIPIDERN
ncbi:pectate lyase [Deltaproteobacteria bacterium]|nr:pectate lyase [Deltaproteobacteria bacterium]